MFRYQFWSEFDVDFVKHINNLFHRSNAIAGVVSLHPLSFLMHIKLHFHDCVRTWSFVDDFKDIFKPFTAYFIYASITVDDQHFWFFIFSFDDVQHQFRSDVNTSCDIQRHIHANYRMLSYAWYSTTVLSITHTHLHNLFHCRVVMIPWQICVW